MGLVGFVYAFGDDFEGVDVEAGIDFVEEGDFWFKDGHLDDFGAFAFAAGEAFVDGAVDEGLIDF